MPETPKYPECERLGAVAEKSNEIGRFLDWLRYEKGYSLAQWKSDELYPVHVNPEALLAEYFEIDLRKVEAERRQMLEEIRNAQRT